MLVRVILDTGVARSFVYDNDEKLDSELAKALPHQLRFSLSGTAFTELLAQLCKADGGISFDEWAKASKELDILLDPRWPFFPAGRELSALTGVQTDLHIDIPAEREYMQSLWRLMRRSRSVSDLECGLRVVSGGEEKVIQLDPQRLVEQIRRTRIEWIEFVEKRSQSLKQLSQREVTEQAIFERMRADLGQGAFDPPDLADRLDCVARVQARLIFQSTKAKDAYNPASDKKKGDAFDMKLLYHLPLPAIVVTADKKFISRIRGVRSKDADRVVSIKEFNDGVRSGSIFEVIQQVRSEERQLLDWQINAYCNWQRRQRPAADDWTDWFSTEPIA